MKSPIRVLVVDDSALMRKLLAQIIESDARIEVIGTALNGDFALRKIEEMKPDVVTLDLEMPGLNGIEVLKQIMRKHKTPVVVVSSHSTQGAAITMKALALGAVDFVAKPVDIASCMPEVTRELVSKIKIAAESKGARALPETPAGIKKSSVFSGRPTGKLIAIGISTGGPNALEFVLSQLPADYPCAIVIVQHMPEGFTNLFARRLDDACAIQVKEAQPGDLLLAGRALICPGNRHIRVKRLPLGDVVSLSEEDRVNGHRPSVDVLFHSVAKEFGSKSVALLMTGMGEDGAEGMGAIKAAGGLTLAQSEDSCVVYGMPRSAVERGHAMHIVSLNDIAQTLQALPEHERGRAASAPPGGSSLPK
jgi:two-component system, chemotaxis family, protein-glutamate methylesterase/glutaminase